MVGEPTQSATELVCDQAIFTSIRTPMGEGYRIIAASRGLRPDEKQAITRSSPSHDSLCWTPAEEQNLPGRLAAAFYKLPTGRLCATLSQHAGEEHTGRGGHRVYTHNVLFDAADFPRASFNAFVVLRSMVDAGLTEPKLKPPPTLPPLSLELGELLIDVPPELPEVFSEADIPLFDGCDDDDEEFWGALGTPWRCRVLESLLEKRNVVVNLTERWTECAEALLMGVPGPLRMDISFSAGIKYSVGRCHALSLVRDENGTTKTRITGRDVEFVDPGDGRQTPQVASSNWLRFIERHWAKGDLVGLSRRTSQAFAQTDAAGRNQISQAFEEIDALPQSTTDKLLKILVEHLPSADAKAQSPTSIERTSTAGRILARRFSEMTWSQAKIFWPDVAALPKKSHMAMRLVKPLVQTLLESAAQEHPLVAAEAALDVFRNASGESNDLDSTRDKVLKQLLDWLDTATETQRSRPCGTKDSPEAVLGGWCRIQPNHPTVQRIHQHLSTVESPGTAH